MALQTITTDKLTWIDISQPTTGTIKEMSEIVSIHQLAIEEFATPTFRPRATQYHNGIFLSIHIPLYNKEERTTYPAELDIILTPTHLVTGHKEDIYQLKDLFEKFNTGQLLQTNHAGQSSAYLLYSILDVLINSCFPRLESITKAIDEIDAGVFHGDEKQMVREISIAKRDILNFRRTIMPQRSLLDSLLKKDEQFIPQSLRPYIIDLIGTNVRLWNMLESQKETITSLEDTNDALLSHKINEKMRIITIFSVILLPSTLYANILGINTSVPLDNHPNGFWIHIGAMLGIGALTLIFFKIRKWI